MKHDSIRREEPSTQFHETKWTIVLGAKAGSFEALEKLCELYREPLRRHILRWRFSENDANDLIQEFMSRKMVEGSLFTSVQDSRPEEGEKRRSRAFSVDDFVGLPSLASKLKEPTRAFDFWMRTQLSDEDINVLANCQSGESNPRPLREALAKRFNVVRDGPLILDTPRFAGIAISKESQILLSRNPQGEELKSLNRLLLEDAYPHELAAGKRRFRTFLLRCLDNFLREKLRRKPDPSDVQVGVSIDGTATDSGSLMEIVAPTPCNVDDALARTDWAEAVLRQAESRHRSEWVAAGKSGELFDAMNAYYENRPDALSGAEMARMFGVAEGAFFVAKHRFAARRTYWMKEVIKETVLNPDDWEEEVRDILGGGE